MCRGRFGRAALRRGHFRRCSVRLLFLLLLLAACPDSDIGVAPAVVACAAPSCRAGRDYPSNSFSGFNTFNGTASVLPFARPSLLITPLRFPFVDNAAHRC